MLKPIESRCRAGGGELHSRCNRAARRAGNGARRTTCACVRFVDSIAAITRIYLLDPEGHVMTWNPGAERIKGYKADEMLGAHFSRFFTQEDLRSRPPGRIAAPGAAQGRVEEEGWRVRKDGSRFWANMVLTAIRDSSGELTGFAKITRDVTERKQAQESVMLELSSLLLANVDIRKLLGAFSASMHQVVPHDAATLALYDEATGKLRMQFLAAGR